MSAAHATEAERLAALRVAAAVLQVRWPGVQTTCRIRIGFNEREAHAAVGPDFVTRVTLRHSGDLVAESLPGLPFVMARTGALASLLQDLAERFSLADDLRLVADALASPELATLRGADLCTALHGLAARLDDMS